MDNEVRQDWLDRDIARAQAAVLNVVDSVTDCDLRADIRRTLFDQLELLAHRIRRHYAELS